MALGEALTQNLLTEQASAQSDAPLPAALTEPFADIVRHCLRWQPEDAGQPEQIGAASGRLDTRTSTIACEYANNPDRPLQRSCAAVVVLISTVVASRLWSSFCQG